MGSTSAAPSNAKRLSITDSAGLNLAALLDEPANATEYPLVILLHGFTGWKEEAHLATLASALADTGIAALRFDAPGSGESEGTWSEHYRATNYLAAVSDVFHFAQSALPCDVRRIGLWGHSMGGMIALISASQSPRSCAAVCGCQPSRGPMWRITPEQRDVWRASGWRTFGNDHFPEIRLPYDFFLDRQRYDAVEAAQHLVMPTLYVAGTLDEAVPAESVRAIADKTSAPKQYEEFEMGHHYKDDLAALAQINAATLTFFRNTFSR